MGTAQPYDPAEATQLLRSAPLFEELDDEDLAALSAALEPRHFAAGAMVFAQGDAGAAMYLVARGDVNIHLAGEGSERISLKDLARGEYFGELALFDDKPRSACAQATSESVLLELRRATLEAYLAHRPRAALGILRTISGRLRETNALLSARVAKNVDAEFDANLSWSDRLADKVAELNGSWRFILFLLVLTVLWCAANTRAILAHPLDPFPFAFFNLALAILVGLQGPLIVMSQNRQSLKDRARAETDFKVNLKNEVNIETLLRELGEFRVETRTRLETLEAHRGADGQNITPSST